MLAADSARSGGTFARRTPCRGACNARQSEQRHRGPLMLLELRADHRYAVIEMGMNHAGEIRYLASLARPDVALITNAGRAHIEFLGSEEAIAQAKGEIFEGLKADGTAVINADDRHARCGDSRRHTTANRVRRRQCGRCERDLCRAGARDGDRGQDAARRCDDSHPCAPACTTFAMRCAPRGRGSP